MKISYRTHPVLDKLEKRKLGILSFSNEESIDQLKARMPYLNKIFYELTESKSSIFYLSKPFIESYNMASKSLLKSHMWNEVDDESYCFLNGDDGFCVSVKNDRNSGIIDCNTFSIGVFKDAESPVLFHLGKITLLYDNEKDDNGKVRSAGFEGYVSPFTGLVFSQGLEERICTYITIILFVKYAKIETRHLPAGQKVKGIDCKYINETKSNITVLDSTWFTTLVKSDGFKVRGHFRLQPKKKDGEWTKELIWISDFEKSGYTAPARKINKYPEL